MPSTNFTKISRSHSKNYTVRYGLTSGERFDNSDGGGWLLMAETQPRDGELNVHLVVDEHSDDFKDLFQSSNTLIIPNASKDLARLGPRQESLLTWQPVELVLAKLTIAQLQGKDALTHFTITHLAAVAVFSAQEAGLVMSPKQLIN